MPLFSKGSDIIFIAYEGAYKDHIKMIFYIHSFISQVYPLRSIFSLYSISYRPDGFSIGAFQLWASNDIVWWFFELSIGEIFGFVHFKNFFTVEYYKFSWFIFCILIFTCLQYGILTNFVHFFRDYKSIWWWIAIRTSLSSNRIIFNLTSSFLNENKGIYCHTPFETNAFALDFLLNTYIPHCTSHILYRDGQKKM